MINLIAFKGNLERYFNSQIYCFYCYINIYKWLEVN